MLTIQVFINIYKAAGVPQLLAILLFVSGVLGALFKQWGLTKKMVGALFMFSFSQGLIGEALRFALLTNTGSVYTARPVALAIMVAVFSFGGLVVGYKFAGRKTIIGSPSELTELEKQVATLTDLLLAKSNAAATGDGGDK